METEHSQFSFLDVTVIALMLETACTLKRRSTFNDTTRRCITEYSTIFKLVEHFFVKMKQRRFTLGLVFLQIAHWIHLQFGWKLNERNALICPLICTSFQSLLKQVFNESNFTVCR